MAWKIRRKTKEKVKEIARLEKLVKLNEEKLRTLRGW
jgi:hypothetical protein